MIFAKPWADALIVLLVVLLFFGPKRLPQLGKSLGEGMREFKDSITGHSNDDQESAGIGEGGSSQPTSPGAIPPEPASTPPPGPEPESAGVAPSDQRS